MIYSPLNNKRQICKGLGLGGGGEKRIKDFLLLYILYFMPIFYIEQMNMALSNPQYVYLIEYGWIIYIHFYISYILDSNWTIFD